MILITVIIVISMILITVISMILITVIIVISMILITVIIVACHHVCFDEVGHRYDSCIGLVCRIQGGQQSLFKE